MERGETRYRKRAGCGTIEYIYHILDNEVTPEDARRILELAKPK